MQPAEVHQYFSSRFTAVMDRTVNVYLCMCVYDTAL